MVSMESCSSSELGNDPPRGWLPCERNGYA
jgi:hypothetical protein